MRNNIIKLVSRLANREDFTFHEKCSRLQEHLDLKTLEDLISNLVEFSVLPESFSHDSREEKLWAKFSDMLLAKSLEYLGFRAEVIIQRSNSADVIARSENYSLVAEAKTSRLSVSTTNPKDLKISAINGWRGVEHNFSLLLAPFRLFFKNKSQIYSEAIRNNVTLLSYLHLSFLLIHYNNTNLERLWTVGQFLQEQDYDFQKAQPYWNAVENTICEIFGQDINEFENHRRLENSKVEVIGNQEIRIFKRRLSNEKSRYERLSKEEIIQELRESNNKEQLIKLVVGSSNTERKIERIQKSINSLIANE